MTNVKNADPLASCNPGPTLRTLHAAESRGWLLALWILGLALLVLGVGGAAAVMTDRADFRTIDTAVLSSYGPPVQPALARDYSRMLRVGEDTVATRLTIFRQAVLYVILGRYSGLCWPCFSVADSRRRK